MLLLINNKDLVTKIASIINIHVRISVNLLFILLYWTSFILVLNSLYISNFLCFKILFGQSHKDTNTKSDLFRLNVVTKTNFCDIGFL